MRIKSKLALGLGFLFCMIITLVVLSIFYVNRVSNDTDVILKDNYITLRYCNDLLADLDRLSGDTSVMAHFDEILTKQEGNITEPGEGEATRRLRYHFEEIKKKPADTTFYDDARRDIFTINQLNQEAIYQKNLKAQQTAKTATSWLSFIGAVLALLAFSFLLNFPGIIANPIKTLSEGIKEISNKNYSQRIHFRSGDEFGDLAEAFNQMASQLERYEHSNLAKIIFEKKRIDTIINNLTDPIIGLDEKKYILFANEAASRVLSINESELIGKYAPDVAINNDLLRNLLRTDGSVTPLKIFADNKESYFSKEMVKITADEKPIGEVIMLKNVTSFKELDLAKTNFIATISHELKTPISSIKMSLKLLEDARVGKLNEEQKKLVAHIDDDSQRLLKITTELLDLAQVETGKIQLERESVDPRSIAGYAFEALRVQAEQKQISIVIQQEADLPKVSCDLDKTVWVMVNLLSNAIHYSPEKSSVFIQLKKQDHSVLFSVKDSGKGIDQQYKDKVFEKFFRVPERNAGRNGTGMGLAISKEFVTAQGGRIWLETEPGKGSTFSFSLPV